MENPLVIERSESLKDPDHKISNVFISVARNTRQFWMVLLSLLYVKGVICLLSYDNSTPLIQFKSLD